MAKITFKGKVRMVWLPDESAIAYGYIQVPELKRTHCDMAAFRSHAKYGGLANSDLFPNVLSRIRKERLGDVVRLDRIPDGVTIRDTGFLHEVSIDV
jgi:hypothetical protein